MKLIIDRPVETVYDDEHWYIIGGALPKGRGLHNAVLISDDEREINHAQDAETIRKFLSAHVPGGTYDKLKEMLKNG